MIKENENYKFRVDRGSLDARAIFEAPWQTDMAQAIE